MIRPGHWLDGEDQDRPRTRRLAGHDRGGAGRHPNHQENAVSIDVEQWAAACTERAKIVGWLWRNGHVVAAQAIRDETHHGAPRPPADLGDAAAIDQLTEEVRRLTAERDTAYDRGVADERAAVLAQLGPTFRHGDAGHRWAVWLAEGIGRGEHRSPS